MLAEREGFEPSVACTTHDFQSCTFSLSVTSPRPVRNAHNVERSFARPRYQVALTEAAKRNVLENTHWLAQMTEHQFASAKKRERRERDSNPRWSRPHDMISSQAPSASRTPLGKTFTLLTWW